MKRERENLKMEEVETEKYSGIKGKEKDRESETKNKRKNDRE